jgi:hypothetical protein
LKARPRGWRDVVRVFIHAGRGLAAAHHAGLVHRDIKPQNILLDAHGRAKVSDFGLARTFGNDSERDAAASPAVALDARVTRTGAIVGTPAYMAPEQLSGGQIDARADQFSFCVALWEAICGRRPFKVAGDAARLPEAYLQAIKAGAVNGPPTALHVPRRVLALVRRGLAPDRTQRWASMDELLDALQTAARPHRRAWLATAAAVGITALVVASEWHSEHAASVCGKRDEIATVWNSIVRAQYLSRAMTPDTALEEAAWFDWYARELEVEYAASCSRAEPRRIACLDEAIEDLRAGIARKERKFWPRLRAIDRCGTPLREVDIGSLTNGERTRLSTDGRELLVSSSRKSVPATIRRLDGSHSRSLYLPGYPRKWRSDGSIVTRVSEGIAVVDEASHAATQYVRINGHVVDISSDLQTVALEVDGNVRIQPVGGGDLGENQGCCRMKVWTSVSS